MQTRNRHPKPRGAELSPRPADLDAMTARSAAEVVEILRSAEPRREGRHPVGIWKTGWLAQPEGAA